MNKKAFTLVELLAVIVILGVILAVAIPSIAGLVENSKKEAFKSTVGNLVRAANNLRNKQMMNSTEASVVITFSDGVESTTPSNYQLEYTGNKPNNGSIIINADGKIALALHDGTWCVEKPFETNEISLSDKSVNDCSVPSGEEQVINPNLGSGMIPIYYDEVAMTWKKASASNLSKQWYDYDNQKWANAVLVTNATRTTYQSAAVGTTILEADVLAYLVWIPRYKYKLFNVEVLATSPQEIEVVFEKTTDAKSTGSTNGTYLTHPAFTFGTTELSGIWVGKFELTETTTNPTVKPNLVSLKTQTVSVFYNTIRKFDSTVDTTGVYGLTNTHDAHMMKNLEWGAVAYLSHSAYGKNAEITINSNSSFYTGGGTGNAYKTNVGQSTTGNIYGIYDMSGGAWEYMMGAQYNSDGITINVSSSGFEQATVDGTEMTKYINKYTYGTTYDDQTAYNRRQLGDATGETRGWHSDYAYFVDFDGPWFLRGGYYSNDAGAGGFSLYVDTGGAYSYLSARIVVS